MQERIVTYQCFTFPGMRKSVENGFKTPDMKTLRCVTTKKLYNYQLCSKHFEESQCMNKET